MKTQITKIGMMLIAFLLLSYLGQAQMTIIPGLTPACHDSSGAVTFTVSGGTGTTYYQLYDFANGGAYVYPPQTSPTFTHLWAGAYEIVVNNSTDSGYLYFSVPTVVNGQLSTTSATCSQPNGTATVTPIGGTAPYSYHWSYANDSTATITGLSPGFYAVTITDANGCVTGLDSLVARVGTISPDSASIHVTGAGCQQTLTVAEFGGPAPYTYSWNTGDTTQVLTAYSGLWNYVVTVTDANGCGATAYATVNVQGLVIDSSNSQVIDPGCGGSNGSIGVYLYTGTAPFTFHWSNGATDSILNGLSAGTYILTVTDANGCVGYSTYTLTNQTAIVAYINGTDPGCGLSDGSLQAYGYTNGNYITNGTFAWSNGANTASISGLSAGSYTVTVSQPGGCSATATYSLTGVANYTVSVTTTPTACDTSLHTGTATGVIINAGVPPYTFTWTEWTDSSGFWVNEIVGTNQTITGLSYGQTVNLIVTDASGCAPLYDSSYATIDLDPSCYDHITGYVYNDSNGNCLRDAGEAGLTNTYVVATSSTGQYYYANPDTSGYYDIEVMPGAYTVTFTFYGYGGCPYTTCTNIYRDTFTVTGQVSAGNDFGIGTSGGDFNLGVHPGCYPSSPGTQKEYWVYYYNDGITAANNVVVSFTHDPNLTLVSTNPAYSNYNSTTHVVSWLVGTVQPYSGWTKITMEFDVPSTLTLGTILFGEADISPISGDCDPTNNSITCSQPVTGSQDPNEKSVVPAGNLSASDTVLTYTIRFQNVGNAPANTIVVIDTLSPNVDPASVVPGASSAPYTFSMSGKGIMTFTFQSINLPDSSHGASSIGFVTYTVHTKPNLALGTTINNTAYVYFDANAAVVTNTTTNERSNSTGISAVKGCSMSAEVVPNPAHDIAEIRFSGATGTIALRITDELGNIITTSNVDSKAYTLDAAGLAPGIYFYTARDVNGNRASGKISVVH